VYIGSVLKGVWHAKLKQKSKFESINMTKFGDELEVGGVGGFWGLKLS